jgi:translation initiation factor 2D
MRAGMRSIPPETRDGIVAIRVHGNPQPMAVGCLTENTTRQTLGIDSKGVGVNVWTCYGDDLWKQALFQKSTEGIVSPIGGACYDNGDYGNVGFLEGKVVKPIFAVDDSDDDSKEEKSDEPDESNEEASLTASQNVEDSVSSSQPQQEEGNDYKESSNGPTSTVRDDGDKDSNADVQEDNPHDVVLHQAVCGALVNIKDSELPMTTANFYAQHVIPHRPTDTTIELKSTTWKKFGTYLEEKVDCGLVTVMPHGTNPIGYLTGIDRKHVDLRGYKKDRTSKTQTTKLQVVNLYIIPHHFCVKLRLDEDAVKAANAKSDQRRGTGMLTVPEARAILEQYVIDNELNVSSGEVRLDGALTDLLYKKQNAPPETLSRKDLNEKWIDKMEPAYALVEMPGNHFTKSGRGTVPRVSIEVSLRQGRKFITRLRGLEDFDIDPVAFTKDVSKRFACSGAIETDAVGREALKKGRVELVFQGHLIEELRALLLGDERLSSHGGARKSDYCLPKTVIDVVLKKGVPAKKPK